jgi:GT2 family glycosyltransferase
LPLIETGYNLGYVGGNNVGIQYALEHKFDHILLLNNDTVVAPDFLDHLVEVADADSQVGVVGPTIYYYERPRVIWSAGGSILERRGLTKMLNIDEEDHGQLGKMPREVDFVSGCALLTKAEIVKEIGGLDERFFSYYEETEWCVRVRQAGYSILHVPLSKIWHKISPSAREASPQVHYYMTRNRLLFLAITKAGPIPWLNTLFFDYARTLVSWSLRPKWRHKAAQRKAMIQGIVDFARKRFGKVDISQIQ